MLEAGQVDTSFLVWGLTGLRLLMAAGNRLGLKDGGRWCSSLSSQLGKEVFRNTIPIHSMSGIYAYIDPPNHPN